MKSYYGFTLGALLLAGAAQAATLPARDGKFLRTEIQGASYELAIAKLAQQKATAPDIKAYAEMVVSDHEQLNSELKQIASAKGVTLPADMTGKQKSNLQRLQTKTGAAFDTAYKQETIRINAEDKKDDQKEMDGVTDTDLRGFVQKLQNADTKHFEAGQKLQ